MSPLTAGEVARRLGIAVTTLRTWHQRYGLGPGQHLPRQHRRYTERDVARLELMRRLTGQGVPAAEAARVAMAARPGKLSTATPRHGGGCAIPLGRVEPAVRGLASAAMRLDGPTMIKVIAAGIGEYGVVHTWVRLLCPVLVAIGDRHAATGRLVEVEHLLSRSISEVFSAVPRPAGGHPPRALLACADDEQHTLPIEALAAALAERGCGSRLLGGRLPSPALVAAVRRTGPAAVLVWSQSSTTGDPEQLRPLSALRPRPVVIAAAGPGWWADEASPGLDRPADLDDALALLLSAAG